MCVIRVPVELTGIPLTSHYISFLFIFVDFSDVVKPIIIINRAAILMHARVLWPQCAPFFLIPIGDGRCLY